MVFRGNGGGGIRRQQWSVKGGYRKLTSNVNEGDCKEEYKKVLWGGDQVQFIVSQSKFFDSSSPPRARNNYRSLNACVTRYPTDD